MGEHGTWFDYLNRFSWWRDFDHWAGGLLGRKSAVAMFPTGFTLTHVLITLLVVLFTAWGAAGILGPAIAARVFDRFGDYRYAFFIAAALSLVACASLTLARPPARAGVHV